MSTRVNGVDLDAGTSGPALSDATPAALGTATAGVSTEASRADHVHEAPAGGVDTSLQAAPDTGWTAAGTASIASGVATLTLGPSDTLARLYRTAPTSPNAPMLEIVARVRRTQAPAGDNHGVGIGLASTAFDAGYFMDARPDNGGQVRALYAEQGGWQLINGMNFISPGDLSAAPGASSVWIRMVITPSWVAFYTDTGATRPTTWGRLGRLIRRDSSAIPSNGWMTTLVILAVRGAGTGTAIFEVDQIQWRSLLGAPA